MQIGELLQSWIQGVSAQILTLIVMIAAQVVLAVVVAWRDKRYEWGALADFYRTRVIPYLVGYVALVVLAKFASPVMLGEQAGVLVSDGVAWGAWLIIMSSLAGKIIDSFKAIFGTASPVKTPAELIDMMTAELEKAQAVAAEVPTEKPEELSKVYEDPKVSETPREQEDV